MKSLSNIIKGQRVRSESMLSLVQVQIETIVPDYEDKGQEIENQEDISFRIKEAEESAKMIVEEAQQKAEQIIANGKQKADMEALVVLKDAKQEGYKQGYQEGYQESKLESKSLINEANTMLESAYAEKKRILEQSESEMIELVITICQKMIHEEIFFNPETIKLLIHKALGEIQYDSSGVIIKVAPSQYEYVVENKVEILGDYVNPEDIEISKGIDLNEGTCVIETPFGNVECNVNDQFTELVKQIRLISSNNVGELI